MTISTAIDASAVARVLGIKSEFTDRRAGGTVFLPQRIAVVGQGASAATYSTDKARVFSAREVAEKYGFGSPLHLAVKQLLPQNGDGVRTIPVTVYPLTDHVSGVAAAGDITPSGTATATVSAKVIVNNIESEAFTITDGDTVADICGAITAAINASLDLPVLATDNTTDVGITAKWKGASGNDLYIEIETSDDPGISFAFTQPTGGLNNPDVTDALDQVGNVWETLILNCLEIADTTALDAFKTFGEGRWGELVRKPCIVFTGNTIADVAAACAVSDARTTDRVNAQLVAPGSNDLPFAVAARQLARIAVVANNNPAHDYGSQMADGITPGDDGAQWTYAQRDAAVKAGSSTIEVRDGVAYVGDVVTFYHPSGDPLPAYRFVCDIVKLQNVLFNIDLEFSKAKWDGAPLIPDDQPTVNPAAKRPKDAIAAAAAIVDGLGANAIISDPEAAKAGIQAGINGSNPKRLDMSIPVQLSGNTNVKSFDLNWGFYFG